MNRLREIISYKELLKTSIRKEIRGKYKGSALGILWSFINPLLSVLVYAIVFPYLMGNVIDNYLIYLVTGIIPWTFFVTVVQAGTTSIRANAGIIKKVYFPREILPLSVAISGVINFFISCLIVLFFVLINGIGISWHLILLPIIAIIQTMLSLALILPLSAINIYIKDTEYIVTFVLNMLFYGTPILYSLAQFTNASKIFLTLINLNPLTHIMNSYRDIFLYHRTPDMLLLGCVFLASAVLLIIGYLIFVRLEKGFAEEV
ncbi:ABC transporter permease [Clostridiaceae bacterium DONG20-135]|uniref:Transport permease protein n=1 Tax=Copranaerobaculum intestinale TaxID=2692629 RepID=A0A6N8U484_9FIRM|nr:ABC transporter permease [Copranaerobaculum intestinale]MXQ72986.1 ABC transporter permease [Copranaerobaculum intestinale]